MNHLGKKSLIRICKVLIKQNDDEEKKLKKYKMVNGNVKKYNGTAQLKITWKKNKENFNGINKIIKIFETIKIMKVNIKDENYKLKYNYEENDEDVQNNKVERFNCGFEGCKQSYKCKEQFLYHFRSHFTGELTCKQCNVTFKQKEGLRHHLLSHENKRQFICPNQGCDKAFNNKGNLNQHKVVHLKNKLQCNYCSYKTNHLRYLKEHIKGRHTKRDLVKCKWPNCGMKFTKRYLYFHMINTHQNTNQFKCEFDGCELVTKYKSNLKQHIKKKH